MDHVLTPRVTCELPVFYATTEGQTARIAERLATRLRRLGFDSRAIDMAGAEAAIFSWASTRAAILGASLHRHAYQPAACRFVCTHAAELNAVPSAFFGVSLSAASREPREVAAADQLARSFPADHGWQPPIVASLAGRLAYTRYGFLTRLLMQWIARREGAPTDTSRDYELTDWAAVEELATDVAARVGQPQPVHSPSAA